MTNKVRLLSLACALGIVTGCGTIQSSELETGVTETVSADGHDESEISLTSDKEKFEISVPIAKRSKQGVIVVEKSIHLPIADQVLPAIYPQPKEKTCLLHAGSHLINLKSLDDFQFSAQVRIPKGVKFKLTKMSCMQGKVVVRAGSGFLGLAVVTNKLPTYFKKTLIHNPKPTVCDSRDLACIRPQTGVIGGNNAPADAVTHELAKSPNGSEKCSVHSGRQNIKIDANKIYSHISGTAISSNEVFSPIYIVDECKFGEKLLAEPVRLGIALGYDMDSPEQKVENPLTLIVKSELEIK